MVTRYLKRVNNVKESPENQWFRISENSQESQFIIFESPKLLSEIRKHFFFFGRGDKKKKKKCFSIEPLAENTILFPLPGSGAALSWTWASAVRAWHLSLLQEPDRACGSGFQNKLPDTMRSGLALLLESGCWSRFRVFAEKNLACGKLFTVWFLFLERSGLLAWWTLSLTQSGIRRLYGVDIKIWPLLKLGGPITDVDGLGPMHSCPFSWSLGSRSHRLTHHGGNTARLELLSPPSTLEKLRKKEL